MGLISLQIAELGRPEAMRCVFQLLKLVVELEAVESGREGATPRVDNVGVHTLARLRRRGCLHALLTRGAGRPSIRLMLCDVRVQLVCLRGNGRLQYGRSKS